jgi:hypothetical protein
MFNRSTCSDNSELLNSGNFQIPTFLASPTGVRFSEVTLYTHKHMLDHEYFLSVLFKSHYALETNEFFFV